MPGLAQKPLNYFETEPIPIFGGPRTPQQRAEMEARMAGLERQIQQRERAHAMHEMKKDAQEKAARVAAAQASARQLLAKPKPKAVPKPPGLGLSSSHCRSQESRPHCPYLPWRNRYQLLSNTWYPPL